MFMKLEGTDEIFHIILVLVIYVKRELVAGRNCMPTAIQFEAKVLIGEGFRSSPKRLLPKTACQDAQPLRACFHPFYTDRPARNLRPQAYDRGTSISQEGDKDNKQNIPFMFDVSFAVFRDCCKRFCRCMLFEPRKCKGMITSPENTGKSGSPQPEAAPFDAGKAGQPNVRYRNSNVRGLPLQTGTRQSSFLLNDEG